MRLARTIGETLDYMRIPTPGDDDLDVIAETFVAVAEDGAGQVALAASIKLVHLGEFTASDRWDIVRFWEDDELAALGQKSPAVSRIDVIDDAHSTLDAILANVGVGKRDLSLRCTR